MGYEGIEPLNSKPVTILLTESGFTDPLWRHIPYASSPDVKNFCTTDGVRTRTHLTMSRLKVWSLGQFAYRSISVDSVGLEPTNPWGRRFTVSRLCRFANYPFVEVEGIEPTHRIRTTYFYSVWPLRGLVVTPQNKKPSLEIFRTGF